MREITACTMDCPDACSLVVSSDSSGITVQGNPDHPFTAGFICSKIKNHVKRLHHPERIVHPMIRAGGRWERIDWDAALNLCAEKIRTFRAEPLSILQVQGSGAKGVLKEATGLFFERLGASRVRGSLCDAAGIIAHIHDFGSRMNNDIHDLRNANRIINWGKDLSRSSIHTAAIINSARRQGSQVLTLSPGDDGNGPFSDLEIRIRPGTDRFLAAAVIRNFIEKNLISNDILRHTKRWETFKNLILDHPMEALAAACDITLSDIDTVFSWYADNTPAATLVGAGLQRYRHGGETVRFINALALISGNIGRPGGGSYFHLNTFENLNMTWIKNQNRKSRRSFRLPLIGKEILEAVDPPVRMIWINGINLINQAADSRKIIRAIETIPFKVVVDAFMTDTAERADLILPAALMLEQEDVIGCFGHQHVQHVKAVLKAPEETKDDYTILSEIGKRLNPPIALPDAETCLQSALQSPFLETSIETLRRRHSVRAKRPEIAYAGLQFDHPDGKYRFPTQIHPEPASSNLFPLRLLTLIRSEAIHSQILPEDQTELTKVWIAPDCPAWKKLNPQKDVYLVSPKGKLKVKLEALPRLHPEAVLYRRGDWIKYGGGANQLIEARLTDLGTGAAFYDQYIRLENG